MMIADRATAAPKHLRLPHLERLAIERVLRDTGGHFGRAALLLGIGRATLYRRLVAPGLRSVVKTARESRAEEAPPVLRARHPSLRDVKQAAIEQAIHAAGGDVKRAARSLGIGRSTLYRKTKGVSPGRRGTSGDTRLTGPSGGTLRTIDRRPAVVRHLEQAFADAVFELGFDRAQSLLDRLASRQARPRSPTHAGGRFREV